MLPADQMGVRYPDRSAPPAANLVQELPRRLAHLLPGFFICTHPYLFPALRPVCMANRYGIHILFSLSGVRVSQRPPLFCADSLKTIRKRMYQTASDVWQICMVDRAIVPGPGGPGYGAPWSGHGCTGRSSHRMYDLPCRGSRGAECRQHPGGSRSCPAGC